MKTRGREFTIPVPEFTIPVPTIKTWRRKLTDSSADDQPSDKKDLLQICRRHGHNDSTNGEHEAGTHDDEFPSYDVHKKPGYQGKDGGRANSGTDDGLLPYRAQAEVVLDQKHRPRDNPSVIPEQQPSNSGKAC